ncbi:MAG: PatB family C-S lyase [Gammaproteobacteria bacterium]|nr:PatB family C-S lyase [Gammaproteobacteria bacterium]
MTFDFDTPVDRRFTGSLKWDRYGDPRILPMWVADMDFRAPPALIEALRARVDHGVFGYTQASEADQAAVTGMLERQYGWAVTGESIVWLPGVVPGLLASARAVGGPGDGILCHTPIYHHFLEVAEQAGRRRVTVPLVRRNNRYTYDLEITEQACVGDLCSMHLCHPHNPVGSAWQRDELSGLLEICGRHGLVVVSDEIHCDLILDQDRVHLPAGMLAPQDLRMITLMSPSKTYNLAGLNCAFAIIPDRSLRRAFVSALKNASILSSPLAFTAMRAAYEQCGDWRDALIDYLRGNRDFLEAEIASIPGLSMTHVEATYLGWIDVSALPVSSPVAWFERHGVGLSGGLPFGDGNHVRINFGCPRQQLREALSRIRSAVREL